MIVWRDDAVTTATCPVLAFTEEVERITKWFALCYELELPGAELGYTPRHYDEIHMYFGAVQAASVDADGRVDAAFDPRRSGGAVLV